MMELNGDQMWSASEIKFMVIITNDDQVVVQGDPSFHPLECGAWLRRIATQFEEDGWPLDDEDDE